LHNQWVAAEHIRQIDDPKECSEDNRHYDEDMNGLRLLQVV